jgi:hypothetical protein
VKEKMKSTIREVDLLVNWWSEATIGDGYTPYILSYHTAHVSASVRDEVKEAGLDNNPVVKEADEFVLRSVLKEGFRGYARRGNQPLEKWWWHLDKIAKREYPSYLLPDYLKEIYENAYESTSC